MEIEINKGGAEGKPERGELERYVVVVSVCNSSCILEQVIIIANTYLGYILCRSNSCTRRPIF